MVGVGVSPSVQRGHGPSHVGGWLGPQAEFLKADLGDTSPRPLSFPLANPTVAPFICTDSWSHLILPMLSVCMGNPGACLLTWKVLEGSGTPKV